MKLEHIDPGDKKFRDWMRHYREEINGEAPPDDWLDQYLKVLFKDQGKTRHIWWAVDQSRKVGFAVATLQRGMVDGRSQGMVAEFFIYPEYRREGLGRRLAEAVIEFLRAQGAGEVYAAEVAGGPRTAPLPGGGGGLVGAGSPPPCPTHRNRGRASGTPRSPDPTLLSKAIRTSRRGPNTSSPSAGSPGRSGCWSAGVWPGRGPPLTTRWWRGCARHFRPAWNWSAS